MRSYIILRTKCCNAKHMCRSKVLFLKDHNISNFNDNLKFNYPHDHCVAA